MADFTTPQQTIPFLIFGVCALAGVLYGGIERPRRKERFAVVRDNNAYLREIGFVGADPIDPNITYFDSEANALRQIDSTSEYLTFMAVGRRNRRAYIRLDESGRMVSYTGIVNVTQLAIS